MASVCRTWIAQAPELENAKRAIVFTMTLLVPGAGFEPAKAMPADLQSAPFGRSGNLACAANSTTKPRAPSKSARLAGETIRRD